MITQGTQILEALAADVQKAERNVRVVTALQSSRTGDVGKAEVNEAQKLLAQAVERFQQADEAMKTGLSGLIEEQEAARLAAAAQAAENLKNNKGLPLFNSTLPGKPITDLRK
jgi:hypothetical protein